MEAFMWIVRSGASLIYSAVEAAVEAFVSVALPHSQQRALQVSVPLKKALSAFNSVSRMLLSVDADVVHSGTWTYREVRREIVIMKMNFDKSEQIISAELRLLDAETETLTAEKNRLRREEGDRKRELANSQTQLEGSKSTLERFNEALQRGKSNLQSAEQTLKNMRERKDRAEVVRDVGIGLMIIPIAGWIVGSALALGGQLDMKNAEQQAEAAQEEVKNCESQISTYSEKVRMFEALVSKALGDIAKVKRKISGLGHKLQALAEKRARAAELQSKTRRAVHQVGLLSGVGSTAELQTRHMILLRSMRKVMEEMVTVLGQVTGDDLLQTEDMRRIMSDMRINHRALQADCSRDSSDEDQDYDCYI